MKTGLYSNDIVLELDNIKELTKKLDNPQNDLKFIHVAGTNGKGSVCAFLENTEFFFAEDFGASSGGMPPPDGHSSSWSGSREYEISAHRCSTLGFSSCHKSKRLN